MKNVTDELQQILQNLVDAGKKPTTALVRARLTTQIPMPAIIAAVKSFTSTASIPKIEIKETEKTAEQRIAQLECQLKELSHRLAILESK